ncbi:N-acetylglucosamine-6-phosphate deacetylase [Kovacikia minuta CCNUW1]|uniref:N-acetylglucosamine-6-phosphate deacetylase n=1 Tax=Kovacikia minuta TaxID=2931930 RepID=UPI001CCB1A81|nr:N-acetylglucosamine-6-phosphate deacetylase [Kovacikia minuta]UBF25214.1 N-acetylglucosamine-6-phosphate deacetylase [Kovacikia minuta CCNUW1]
MVDRFDLVNTHLVNVSIPGIAGLQRIRIRQGVVETVLPIAEANLATSEPVSTVDLEGDWVSPGGIDLQINGALGLAFPDLNAENVNQLNSIGEYLWRQGIDGFLPTIVTTSVENIQRSLATLSQFKTQNSKLKIQNSAQILGVHLEGPFLNPHKRGAHPQEFLQSLTVENVKRVLGEFTSLVKVITLAPELDQTGEVIPYLRSLGITVSLGHSLATAEQAQLAFAQGATMVTHAFNAMPPLHHREPGLLGAAIVQSGVCCGLIADGQHVSPIMMEVLLRASNDEEGIFLVSDALSPLGLPDGVYPWDLRQIEVKYGTARLPDGTLSGTTLPLLVGAQNLVKWGICEPERAIALATTAPRRAIGLPTQLEGTPLSHLLHWHRSPIGGLEWQRFGEGVKEF